MIAWSSVHGIPTRVREDLKPEASPSNPTHFQVTPRLSTSDSQPASDMDKKQSEEILDVLKDLGERVLANESKLDLICRKLVSP